MNNVACDEAPGLNESWRENVSVREYINISAEPVIYDV